MLGVSSNRMLAVLELLLYRNWTLWKFYTSHTTDCKFGIWVEIWHKPLKELLVWYSDASIISVTDDSHSTTQLIMNLVFSPFDFFFIFIKITCSLFVEYVRPSLFVTDSVSSPEHVRILKSPSDTKCLPNYYLV